jgi:hypothetical protein
MPGEIQQWTPEEIAKFEVLPVPSSGKVTLTPVSDHRYLLDCANVSGADVKKLEEFWNGMMDGFHPFRYQSATHHFPHCVFRQPAAHFVTHAPNRCSVQFAIETLPPYEI